MNLGYLKKRGQQLQAVSGGPLVLTKYTPANIDDADNLCHGIRDTLNSLTLTCNFNPYIATVVSFTVCRDENHTLVSK